MDEGVEFKHDLATARNRVHLRTARGLKARLDVLLPLEKRVLEALCSMMRVALYPHGHCYVEGRCLAVFARSPHARWAHVRLDGRVLWAPADQEPRGVSAEAAAHVKYVVEQRVPLFMDMPLDIVCASASPLQRPIRTPMEFWHTGPNWTEG